MITGNVSYCIASDTLIYAIVDDRQLFDLLPLPVSKTHNDNVLVKMDTIGPAQVIYQHWLKSPLEASDEH